MPTPEQIEAMRTQVAQYDQERIDEANAAAAGKVALAQALAETVLTPGLATQIEEAREQSVSAAPQLASVLDSMKRLVELFPTAIERAKAQAFQAIRAEQPAVDAPADDEPAAQNG